MMLKGTIPVIPTPLAQGTVEYEGFDKLLESTLDSVDGYVVCGSTGEAPALTTSERMDIARYFGSRLPKAKAMVIGLGHTSLEDAASIGQIAAEAGAQAALVPSPYYFPNSLDMVIDYIGSLAERIQMDIVFYDNPVTTKTTFTLEQLIALSKAVPRVKGIKMTDHNFAKIRGLKAQTGLQVFGGDDIICFQAFMAGVDGNMIIVPTVYPEEFKACWEAFRAGEIERSFAIYSEVLLPFIGMFGPGDEVPTTKGLFHHIGLFASPDTRPPLLRATDARMREVLLGYRQGLDGSARRA